MKSRFTKLPAYAHDGLSWLGGEMRQPLMLLVLGAVLLAADVLGEELFSYKGIQVSVAKDYSCGAMASMRLDVKSEDQIRQSRLDMQQLSDMVKTYLWLDCENIESIDYEGFVEGNDKPVYHATAKKKDKWYLDEKSPDTAPKEQAVKKNQGKVAANPGQQDPSSKTAPSAAVGKKQPKLGNQPVTQQALEQKAAKGSVEAMVELVKGLLGLSEADPTIEFQQDDTRGMELLEQLAANGNQDAKHLLGEAYNSDKQRKMNVPLLEKVTSDLLENPDSQRGKVAAKLTVEAAAKGAKEAIAALAKAGQSGSNLAYYALGAMYLLDKQEEMPVDSEFLEERLNINTAKAGSGGFGNADVGLHFLTLAAEKGNADAQGILEEMGVEFEVATAKQSASGFPSLNQPGSGAANPQASSSSPAQTSTSSTQNPVSANQQAGNVSNTPVNAPASSTQTAASSPAVQAQAAGSQLNVLAEAMSLFDSMALEEMIDDSRSSTGAQVSSNRTLAGSPQQQAGQADPSQGSGRQQGASRNRGGSAPRIYDNGGKVVNYSPVIANKPMPNKDAYGAEQGQQETEDKPIEILD